jgi:hypothetical protein
VAIFVAHRQLIRFGTLMLGFAAPIQAELAMLFGGGGVTYRDHAFRATEILIWLSVGALVFATTGGVLLFGLWTSGRLEVHHTLLVCLGVATFGETAWRSVLLPILAINRHTRIAFAYLVVSVAVLVPSLYFLTVTYALIGAAVALVLAEFVMLAATARESVQLLNVSWTTWIVETIRPPFWVLREGIHFLTLRRGVRRQRL